MTLKKMLPPRRSKPSRPLTVLSGLQEGRFLHGSRFDRQKCKQTTKRRCTRQTNTRCVGGWVFCKSYPVLTVLSHRVPRSPLDAICSDRNNHRSNAEWKAKTPSMTMGMAKVSHGIARNVISDRGETTGFAPTIIRLPP